MTGIVVDNDSSMCRTDYCSRIRRTDFTTLHIFTTNAGLRLKSMPFCPRTKDVGETFNLSVMHVSIQTVTPHRRKPQLPCETFFKLFTGKSPECESKARRVTSRVTQMRCSWWSTVSFLTRTLCASVFQSH